MAPFDGPLIGNRYRLGPKLGKGSQGEIFLARDTQAKGGAEAEVVVKRLASEPGDFCLALEAR